MYGPTLTLRSFKGLDVWTRGQATLLNATASFYSGAAPAQLIGVNDGTDDCIIFTDGTALKKQATSAGSPTTISQAGTASTIYSLTTDGSNYYFINGTKVHKGSVGATPADSEIYDTPSTTRATIRYVKQRLILAKGNILYELNANATGSAALPTALYTHPNANWVWSSIAEGPQAIYVSGYDPNGTSSSVFKIGLNEGTANALGFPTLLTPTVIIDMPSGERINDFEVYLGTYAVLAPTSGFVSNRFVVVVSAILKSPYAASCQVIELSSKSDQFSEVSETGVQDSEESVTGVQLSELSDCAVHDSGVSGTAPQPKPIIVPTDPKSSTPLIAISMVAMAVPSASVPSTPVISCTEMTSGDNVPRSPVAALPVMIGETRTELTAPVAELPVMATVLLMPTVPTLPVAMFPFS